MSTVFVAIGIGYWGKGHTPTEAIFAMFDAGGADLESLKIYKIDCDAPKEKLYDLTRVDGSGLLISMKDSTLEDQGIMALRGAGKYWRNARDILESQYERLTK